MNRKVNCKVSEFATESAEAWILKGCVCISERTGEGARH